MQGDCCSGTECGNSPGKKEPMADQGCQVLPTCPYSGLGQHRRGGHPDSAWGQQACVWFLWLRQLVSFPSPPRSAPSLPPTPPHLFLIRLFHRKCTEAPECHLSWIQVGGDVFPQVPSYPPPRCSDTQCSVRTVVQPHGLDSRPQTSVPGGLEV